jgi:hypothetical protein
VIALMLTGMLEVEPEVTVQNSETKGKKVDGFQATTSSLSQFLKGFVNFALVYFSALLAYLLFRKRNKVLSYPIEANGILFVAAVCGITRLQDRMWQKGPKAMAIFGAADIITAEGKKLPGLDRGRFVRAIECLTLIKRTTNEEPSLLPNLQALDPNYSAEKYDALRSNTKQPTDLTTMRQVILAHASTNELKNVPVSKKTITKKKLKS